jgi:hypothetical protein
MSDIFVSYAKEDRPRAKAFALALQQHGWSVFWDRVIPTGKTWRDVIGSEINAARCIVVLWSASSVHSRWVLEEADIAAQRGVLTPVLLDPVAPPLGFTSFQAADLTDWDGDASAAVFQALVTDIRAMLPARPLADDEPRSVEDRDMKWPAAPDQPALATTRAPERSPPLQILPTTARFEWSHLPLWILVASYAAFAANLYVNASGARANPSISVMSPPGNAFVLVVGVALSYLTRVGPQRMCAAGALFELFILAGNLFRGGRHTSVVTMATELVLIGGFAGLFLFYRRRDRLSLQFVVTR